MNFPLEIEVHTPKIPLVEASNGEPRPKKGSAFLFIRFKVDTLRL